MKKKNVHGRPTIKDLLKSVVLRMVSFLVITVE